MRLFRSSWEALPLHTCHSCGYDMEGHATGEACPECGTAYAPDKLIYTGTGAYMTLVIAMCVIAILAMMFIPPVALLALILSCFLYPMPGKARLLGRHRIPHRVWWRTKLCYTLWIVMFVEFWLIMLLDTIYPPLFDWW